MSAALVLNPLFGAAPVDPARPSSSEDAGFAGVLASATAAGAGGEAGDAPAVPLAPTAAPATTGTAAVTNLLAASAGKGPAQPVAPGAAGALPLPEAGGTPDAATPAQAVMMPSLAPTTPVDAASPLAAVGDDTAFDPEAPAAGALMPTVVSPAALAPQGTAATPTREGAATAPAGASTPLGADATVAQASLAGPAVAGGVDARTALGASGGAISAAALASAPEASVETPFPTLPANEAAAEGAGLNGRSSVPVNAEAASQPGEPVAIRSGAPPAVSRPETSPVAAVSVATGNPAGSDVEVSLPAPATPAAAAAATVEASPAVVTPALAVGSPPAVNGAVQAQLAAAGAALLQKPAARRTDAPAAAEVAQPATATVPSDASASLELPAEAEAATPPGASNGSLALNGQPGAATSPTPGASAATTAGPSGQPGGIASTTGEAAPVALVDLEADLTALDATTDLPAGEAARLLETPLPTASSIVLQPMVNDGRFNAVAQISAQILRRLEGQTTRFELALTPEDLGRVDVMLEIDGDGAVTARLAFDNPAAAAELRAQADQLRRELEAAGLNVSRDGLQFAERDARRDDGGNDRRGAKAFAGAARLEADADVGLAAYRMTTADGRLDVRI